MNQEDTTNATHLLARTFGQDVIVTDRVKIDVDWAPVERWWLHSPFGDVPQSVIIKTRRHNEEAWGGHPLNLVAERKALSHLQQSLHTPCVYAHDDELGIIIMENIRDAVTVERLLFGSNEVEAVSALLTMARAVGIINGSTAGISKGVWNPSASIPDDPESSWRRVRQLLADNDFDLFGDAGFEISEISRLIGMDEFRALTHWDVNPSNAMIGGGRAVIIDFEGANPRHMAIDGATFALAFEHYRCWAPLPDEITDAMAQEWMNGVTEACGNAPTHADLLRHLAAGAVCLTLGRMERLPRIADAHQPMESSIRRRTQIIHTLEKLVRWCERADAFPSLSQGFKSGAVRDEGSLVRITDVEALSCV